MPSNIIRTVFKISNYKSGGKFNVTVENAAIEVRLNTPAENIELQDLGETADVVHEVLNIV